MQSLASPFASSALGLSPIPSTIAPQNRRAPSRTASMQHRILHTEPESIYSFPIYDDLHLPSHHCSPLPMEPVPLDLAGLFDHPNSSDYFSEDSIQYAPSLWSTEACQTMRLVSSSSPLLDSDLPSTRSSTSSPTPPPATYRFRDHATDSLDSLFYFDFQGSTTLPDAYPSPHCLDPLTVLPPADSPYDYAAGTPPPPSISCLMNSSVSHRRTQSLDSSPSTSDSGTGGGGQYHQKRRFPCEMPGCARRFTSQYTLKVHMQAHRPKPKVSFPCTEGCSERFSRQHDRLRHEVAKHGKICEFLCDDCGRFFSTRKTLGNHKCPVAQGGTRWVTN
jgi:hypothetical protein